MEQGNPVPAPSGRLTVRHAVVGLEQDVEKSECLSVMDGIPGATFPAQYEADFRRVSGHVKFDRIG